jgi:hypothetical protein
LKWQGIRESLVNPKTTNGTEHAKEDAVKWKGHAEVEPPGELKGDHEGMHCGEPTEKISAKENRTDNQLCKNCFVNRLTRW